MPAIEGQETVATMRPKQAAALLRCTTKNLTHLVRVGKLRAERTPGKHRRYFEAEVIALAAQGACPSPPATATTDAA